MELKIQIEKLSESIEKYSEEEIKEYFGLG